MSPEAPQQETRVLYVGGTGRSGSTVLANVLGEVPGLVSVGELRFLWERGVLENRLCGCGQPFSDCAFWSEVISRTVGKLGRDELESLARTLHAEIQDSARLRQLPKGVMTGSVRPASGARITEILPRLYAAIADVSGAQVVVDSSKLPTYARLLADTPGLAVSVLHLLRDPRAAAFSWRRTKEQPDRGTPGIMERRGVTKSAALWTAWNYGLEKMWRGEKDRYQRLGYEEFLADPKAAIARVLAGIGVDAPIDDIFPEPGAVRLSVSHTVAGNPARLKHGLVPIKIDDEWRSAMPSRDRRVVTALSYPLLRRHGYHRQQ